MKGNNSGDDLSALIQSMGQSEKRYFKIFASEGVNAEDKNLIRLFDYLQKKGSWVEKDIRLAFAGEAFLAQLNVVRTRLQQLILEALSRHDQGKSYQLEFSRRFNEIDVLYRRKLLSACARTARAAMRHAKKLNLSIQEYQALTWMLRLERQFAGTDLNRRLEQMLERQKELSNQIVDEVQLVVFHDKMLCLLPQNTIEGLDCQKEANALLVANKHRFPTPQLLPFDGRILHFHFLSCHALIIGDQTAYFESCHQLVETWESLPERIRLEEERYFRTLLLYTESATKSRNDEAFIKGLAKLKRIIANSTSLRPVENVRILNLELRFLGERSNWKQAIEIVPEIQKALQKFNDSINPLIRINLLSNVIVALFVCEKWLPIQTWISTLEADPGHQSSPSFDGLTRTTRWVAYYELQDHETLEKSLYPFLKTTKTVAPDPLALAFAGLLACESEAQEINTYQALQVTIQDLQTIGNMPHLDLLDTWVKARIKGISLEQAESLRDH